MKQVVKKTITCIDKQLVNLSRTRPGLHFGGPIFVIGPPRSGTTLAYQLLTACFDFGYITNFEAQRPYAPGLSAVIAKFLDRGSSQAMHFSSEYGRTPGRFGPHEAGRFWYRWFPAGECVYIRGGELGAERSEEMRKFLLFLETVKNKPLIFKNVYHCARIGILKEVFPEAVFIVIRRTPLEVAQSILRAREKTGGGRAKWWSLPLPPPHGIPDNMHWPEQIIRQVEDVYCEIDEQRVATGSERFFDLDYTSLCREPERVLHTVRSFLESKDIRVTWRQKPPASFEPGPVKSVSNADYIALSKALAVYHSESEEAR